MAKYKQTYIFDNEDSFGENTFEFIFSDSIETLTDETESIEVNNILFDKLENSLKGDFGGLIQKTIKVMIADFYIDEENRENETNCLEFLLSCITNKIYCAVLYNPQSPLAKEDVLFAGMLNNEYEEEAKKWNRDEYSESAEIIKAYRLELIPIANATFDEISMKDITDNILSSWISSNVADRQSWRKYSQSWLGVDYEVNTYCADLVNLNKLLRKIGDDAMTIFNTINSTSYTLNFTNRVKLTGKYAPARWRVSDIDHNQLWVAATEKINPNESMRSSTIVRWENVTMYHNLDDATDYREYYIDPDEIETFSEDDSLWVDAKYFIDLGNDNEYSKSSADSYRIDGKDLTFTDFLYKFATNFGFLFTFELDVINEEINITFINSDYIENEETLYFKDASKFKRSIISGIIGESKPYYSESFYGVGETNYGLTKEKNSGVIYGKDWGGVIAVNEVKSVGTRQNKGYITEKKEDKLLFTISPTVAMMSLNKNVLVKPPFTTSVFIPPSMYVPLRNGNILPHNTKVLYKRTDGSSVDIVNMKDSKKVGDEKVGFAFTTRSLHTGIYVKVPQKQSYEPSEYFTPIRFMSVKIDGDEFGFDTIEAFLNYSLVRERIVSEQDIEISIPYWNAFSNSSEGTNPSLKNLKLGKKIVINEIAYVIREYNVDFNKPEINLKLHIEKIFSEVKNPSTPKTSSTLLGAEDLIDADNNVFPKYYVDGTTDLFSALCYTDNEDVKTITTPEEAERFLGLAIENKEDDYVQVLEANGEYDFFTTGYDIGDILYLRIDGTTSNVGTSPANTYHSSTDCVYLKVAEIIRTNKIKVFKNIPIEFSETNF